MNVNNFQLADLYTDYLIASSSYTTATGLSSTMNHSISHDKITRLLNQSEIFNSKAVWQMAKPIVREFETHDGCIAIDDCIEEKRFTDENELICWHWDHTKGRNVKGVNFVSAFYNHRGAGIPLAVEFVKKSIIIKDSNTGKSKRKSERTKNEIYRELLYTVKQNQVKYQYVLNDTWFACADNMKFVKNELKKDFIMAIKENRKVALSMKDKIQGKYVGIKTLELEQDSVVKIYLKQIDFPLLLVKKIFKNKDNSIGILYLVTSALDLTYEQITIFYHKRWRIEEYHKSVKHNVSFSKSPTKTVKSQLSHFYASILAYIKMELLSFRTKLNHFAIKSKIYLGALQTAMCRLNELSTIHLKNQMTI